MGLPRHGLPLGGVLRMTAVPISAPARAPLVASPRRAIRAALPALSLALIVIAIWYLNPRAISYLGFNLMLNLAIPITLATIAQMFVITVNDLDLSIGFFVSFVGCVTATLLNTGFTGFAHVEAWFGTPLPAILLSPLVGVVVLVACIGVYATLGALIHLRNLPSIVVTWG